MRKRQLSYIACSHTQKHTHNTLHFSLSLFLSSLLLTSCTLVQPTSTGSREDEKTRVFFQGKTRTSFVQSCFDGAQNTHIYGLGRRRRKGRRAEEGVWELENLPVYLLSTLEARLPGCLLPASTESESDNERKKDVVQLWLVVCCVVVYFFKLSTQQSLSLFICCISDDAAIVLDERPSKSLPTFSRLNDYTTQQQQHNNDNTTTLVEPTQNRLLPIPGCATLKLYLGTY